jgi:hypothetical protein
LPLHPSVCYFFKMPRSLPYNSRIERSQTTSFRNEKSSSVICKYPREIAPRTEHTGNF